MMRRGLVVLAFALIAFVTLAAGGSLARADDDPTALFTQATRALKEGRAGDAIAALEALADSGVVDPVASYDRGLAYAMRVRIGAEVPGDLGRAAHGFEEARDLSRDAKLTDDATRALTIVRSEVARRRTRAGQPVEVDPGRSLSRTLASFLPEDTWSFVAVASSALLAIGLLVRWLARAPRLRVACAIAAGMAAPALAVSVGMTLSARHARLNLREAVIVTSSDRPNEERGIVVAGGTPLPEGARVEVLEARGPQTRVRFGAVEASVAAGALRDLAR
jgi:hypothetical protein